MSKRVDDTRITVSQVEKSQTISKPTLIGCACGLWNWVRSEMWHALHCWLIVAWRLADLLRRGRFGVLGGRAMAGFAGALFPMDFSEPRASASGVRDGMIALLTGVRPVDGKFGVRAVANGAAFAEHH
jgi:hypothetical protein